MIGRLFRSLAVLLAVATATMPGLIAVAEGVLEATAAGTTVAHVEPAGGSESCPVVHDAHCAACSLLRHGYTGPESSDAPWALVRCAASAPAAVATAGQQRLRSAGNPRAPPAA